MAFKERLAAIRQRLARPEVGRDLAGIVGLLLVAFGVWEIYRPAGFIVLGAMLLAGVFLSAKADA